MSQAHESLASPILDEPLYEVIDGRKVELPPMGINETVMASTLCWALADACKAVQNGRVVVETLFALSTGGPKRRPDLAFVSYDRWPRKRLIPRGVDAWDVVPDLAIEVVSPSNTADEVNAKVRDYFEAGVRRVWVIYPGTRQVYVHDTESTMQVVGPDGILDAEGFVPGFRITMTELFEDVDGDVG